ncbi:Crp/Fnr family transcriptional regulator [Fluviicola taffensis]|uniref:Transcriptional regulator, Crp/Fnr family n=1 Tax=Fluviicola taffensis (strain DSM 16823 / NCIMB 13979 / RW262) TaxID=755732 RepID=F2ID81_FLUTR|nr:Crp/Fnr family transcriptional regulator [Fluviicola taffensis]AEA45496.1 transcriptional regulator, Crp/Fnr family [Fluviicola taffensis DSM 16823]
MNPLDKLKDLFEEELVEEINEKSHEVRLKEGDLLLDTGQIVRVIPIVLSGTLKISRVDEEGHELFLYYIHPHESCAMTFTCCMEEFPSEIRAVADEDSIILTIPITAMDKWMMKYASWKSFIMKTIHSRFNELLIMIDQIAFQRLDERLVHYLKEKSKSTHSTVINLSHEQIAIDLSSSREVISRLLKRLEKDNKVVLYRNQIKLLSNL